MIGRLRGRLLAKQPPQLLVDVSGVGYEVDAPMTTFYGLPALGEEITLHTHLVVREDAHQLYGFATETERTLFRQLIKINGVGAKLALAILSGMPADELVRCVKDGDTARLVRLPGIGKKTAERLVMELRDRLKSWGLEGGDTGAGMPAAMAAELRAGDPAADAVSALEALGYKPQEASRMVRSVNDGGHSTSEQIIRAALQAAARNL